MKTTKGKGVSYMENAVDWHGKAPSDAEYETAMDELRAVVRRSEAVNTYEPHHTPEWEAAYAKLKTLI